MGPIIFAIAEHFEGKIRPITYELVACAQELQQHHSAKLVVIIIGDDIETMALEIAQTTGTDVLALHIPGLNSYNGEVYSSVLEQLIAQTPFTYMCIAHTTQGMDFAPVLAVKTDSACITGIEGIIFGNNRLSFTRTVFNGKAVAKMSSSTDTTVLTIQPGMFTVQDFNPDESGGIEIRSLASNTRLTHSMGLVRSRTDNQTITEADVVISAGRGLGKKENLDLIYQLADLFSKSAVGASRPLCDIGWLGYQQQVGITGLTVSPNLYFACGISGAIQHLTGIRGAGFIVAVNTDPNAAIFNMSDVCIVEDLTSFLPVFIEEFKNALS